MSLVLKDVKELLKHELPTGESKNLFEILSGMALESEFCEEIVKEYPGILLQIIKHFITSENESTEAALNFMINLSSHSGIASKIYSIIQNGIGSTFSNCIVKVLLKSDSIIKSKMAQFLSNITRENIDVIKDLMVSNYEDLDCIFRIGLLCNENVSELLRDDVSMIILNFSQGTDGQKYIMENLYLLNDLIEMFKNSPSEKWMLASFGLIKNLLKNSDYHNDLVEKTDLLTILLHPLVGLNEYNEKISDAFPEKLKSFVGKYKEIPHCLRCIILEALYLLSGTKSGRNKMRSCNVYDILKNISELDLTDEESDNCLDCIGLLIRYEHEIDCDDLLKLTIPGDVEEKFKK